ncbi:MAG: 4-alpha-glucanotransferase [Akkermansiaceae bacterium]|nr:4-alpha-glucanotransferase [Akkermansiaceae bacterium]NNM28525.1 4-alpha-glucanotransferase [Akkermansiaceae bacterium]
MRRAGMLVPVWSLRRDGELGIGDTGALRQLIDWAAEHKLGFLQLLPINETGNDHSPYNAISSVALEPALLQLEDLPELSKEDCRQACQQVSRDVFTGAEVDYPAVKTLKHGLLAKAFEVFWRGERDSARGREFEDFRRAEAGWLEDYCRFRWLMSQEGGSEAWDLWSINYNTPEKARTWIERKHAESPDDVDRELAYFAWVQWVAFTQWRNLRNYAHENDVKLMGDIPIGISYYSADVFFEPQWFDLQWSGGAPPETVFKDDAFAVRWGQNWGIPLYRWDVLERDRFHWWRRRIEKLTDVFQIFRIDHILGFYRIYAFPWRPIRNREFLTLSHDEAAARTHGRLPGFKPRPDDTKEQRAGNLEEGDKYIRVVQEAAGDNEVVGEDLGAVPEYVRPHLLERKIAGFKICHWEVERDKHGVAHAIPGADYPECSFATYATHDHPSIAAMWRDFRHNLQGVDEDARAGARWNLRVLSEFAGIPLAKDENQFPPYDEEVKWKLLAALLDTNSRYAAFMITDLFGMTERFNIPGTVGGQNWRIRMPFTVEEMRRRADLCEESEKLRVLIHDTRR